MAASAMESSQLPGSQRALPSGFEYINDIMNMPSSRLKAGALVNVIGFVMDYQPPIRSRGTGESSHGLGSNSDKLMNFKISNVL